MCGKFACVVWPATRHLRRAEWNGPLPKGIVAVIHSHQRLAINPSQHDVFEACRVGIPMIVVTPTSLVMAKPCEHRRIVTPVQ